ncbi:alpha-L-arabinofuranosidase C-terminal domain-containing protein [Streptomyces sp. NPDC059373]
MTDSRAVITVDASAAGVPISPDLFGIFFEDLNHAADGGLYAELVQNRSFSYSGADRAGWHALTAWEPVCLGGAEAGVTIGTDRPPHPNSPHHAEVRVTEPGGGAGLRNGGFDGIAVTAGEQYNVRVLARRAVGGPAALTVRLESAAGAAQHGEAALGPVTSDEWTWYTATLEAASTDPDARFTLLTHTRGVLHLAFVSLLPRATFRDRPNGMRADLAQAIADLQPKFVRFPGGCVAHGLGLDTMYRWKDTVGPLEWRRTQPNLWGYHQSAGLGYFEYFQFCEDIGAKPLPVVAAGVCCQNAPGGQQAVPEEDMPLYVQEVLDLVEYANGPPDSPWGAVRAAAGHPEPFGLAYLGVGNEDQITPEFRERFDLVHAALREHHPEITVIGTTGPAPVGAEWEQGWELAHKLDVEIVDEHSYKSPRWFLENTRRFDALDRSGPELYVGEYAARGNTMLCALAEATYMIAMERAGDVVRLSSYAPLLAKVGNTQWVPDLIYFDNAHVHKTLNYHVQRMHSSNSGDSSLPVTVSGGPSGPAEPRADRHGISLGTCATRAEFADVRIDGRPADGWEPRAGEWEFAGGVLRQTGDDPEALSVLASAAPAGDCVVTLRARRTGGAEGFVIGFGRTAEGDHYQWNLGGWRNRSLTLQRSDDGFLHDLADPVPHPMETGRWYDVRVELSGSRVRCLLDGRPVHDLEDVRHEPERFAVSSVRDSRTGDVIVKVANTTPSAVTTTVDLHDAGPPLRVTATVLAAAPGDGEPFAPAPAEPHTVTLSPSGPVEHELPPYSFTVIRAVRHRAS